MNSTYNYTLGFCRVIGFRRLIHPTVNRVYLVGISGTPTETEADWKTVHGECVIEGAWWGTFEGLWGRRIVDRAWRRRVVKRMFNPLNTRYV